MCANMYSCKKCQGYCLMWLHYSANPNLWKCTVKAEESCVISQKSLVQTLLSYYFLVLFYITCLTVLWVLYVPFINRSLYKSHKDFSKDKPHLLNIMHSLSNFNKSHKQHQMYLRAVFYVYCCLSAGLFSPVFGFRHWHPPTPAMPREEEPFGMDWGLSGLTLLTSKPPTESQDVFWALEVRQGILSLYAANAGKYVFPTDWRALEESLWRNLSDINNYSISKCCWTMGHCKWGTIKKGMGEVMWGEAICPQTVPSYYLPGQGKQTVVISQMASPAREPFSRSACCLLPLLSWPPFPKSIALPSSPSSLYGDLSWLFNWLL